MSEHDNETTLANLRETVRRQGEELAELRALVAAFGSSGDALAYLTVIALAMDCRSYNRRKATT